MREMCKLDQIMHIIVPSSCDPIRARQKPEYKNQNNNNHFFLFGFEENFSIGLWSVYTNWSEYKNNNNIDDGGNENSLDIRSQRYGISWLWLLFLLFSY